MNRSLRTAVRVAVSFVLCSPAARGLTISEIMYNPGPDGVEYVEIYNEDGEARDLSKYHFTHGFTFQFSGYADEGSVYIRGKSYLVVTKDLTKLLKLYPYLDNADPLFPAAVGNYSGSLDNAGEKVTLANPGGAVDAEVTYNNRGAWPSAADGTGHSLVLKNPDLDEVGKDENWTFSPLPGGSPGLSNFGETVFTETTLVGSPEKWLYWKGKSEPSDPREAWRKPVFDTSLWTEGTTPLGFGGTCYTGTVLDDMLNSYLSVYFRKTFEVPDVTAVDVLTLKIAFDDGFIAYLNGQEVAKKNMNNGDAFDAKASATSRCTTTTEFNIPDPQSKLIAGTNVLCIQVHNNSLTSNTFGLIPQLLSKKGRTIGSFSQLDVDLNELFWNTQAGEAWLEIYNDQDAEQDLSGFYLSDDPLRLNKYAFPPDTKLSPHGFLVVNQAQVQAAGIDLAHSADKSKFLALSRPIPSQPAPWVSVQVVDAYRFKITPSQTTVGMSDARYPDGTHNWFIARTPTRGTSNQLQAERSVVLNEIMYHSFYPYKNDFVPGTDGYDKPEDQGEYLEIYNRGAAPVNIGGWSLAKGVEFQFTPGTILASGGYLVVARDPQYIRSTYGLPAEQVLGPWYNQKVDDLGIPITEPAVLSDSGEKIELQDEIGNAVDTVHYYDNNRWSPWADTRGSSLERIDPNQAGNRAPNWDASDESLKSEWKHYSWKGKYTEGVKELQFMLLTRGIVLIDNLSVTDPANLPAGNYIKNGDFELALATNWQIDGTHISSGRITYDKKDGQACLKVIATGRGNNRIDRIRYSNPTFPTNKDLVLEFDAKWICGEATLMFTGTWNTFGHRFFLEVPRQGGTPGKENSVHARLPEGSGGPLVDKVRQTPVLPGAAQDVVMTAEVTDSDGVKDVKLKYSIDSVRAAVTELAMLDDGQGPDKQAGDGIYSCLIPGQPLGKRVVFSIEASDNARNIGRFPYDDRQRTNPYLLDPATTDLAKLRYASYIYATMGANTAGVPEYRMVLSTETTNYLTTRHIMNNDVVDASFVWNDSRIWYNVGVRYGNSPWTRSGGKSYVMKMPREDQLQGYKKFKLDNRGSEINERAEYYLIRSQNVIGRDPVPFGRSTYTRPFLNANSAGSVFERVEIPGKQFVDRWWPHDAEGVLYKLDDKFLVDPIQGVYSANRDAFIRYPPDGVGDGDDPEEYRWYFLHRTREKYDDFSELSELAKFFTTSKTPQATYDAQLFDRLNVEATIRTLAVEINADDWDTWGTTRGKNCYFYRPRVDGRWVLIGWDKDLTFGNPGGLPMVPAMFPEVSRLLNSSGGKKVYSSILNDMLATYYNADYVNQFFNEHARDKNGKPITGLPPNAAGIAAFLTNRAGMIKSYLPRTQPKFELITGGVSGEVVSPDPSIVVEGNAPLSLWHMEILNPGQPNWLDPSGVIQELILEVNQGSLIWQTPTRWKTTLPVPLAKGINGLTFAAFASDGTLLGSDDLRVVYNLDWIAPTVTAVQPNQGPASGGTEVVVRGTGFHAGAKVFFGTALAEVKSMDETAGTITVKTPAGASGPVEVKVQNIDGKSGALAAGFIYGGARFNRGDVDLNGVIDLSDAINILLYMFSSGGLPCLDAADIDDDGAIGISDPIGHINYQFLSGPLPAAPFDPTGAQMGEDPTADTLGCLQGS